MYTERVDKRPNETVIICVKIITMSLTIALVAKRDHSMHRAY